MTINQSLSKLLDSLKSCSSSDRAYLLLILSLIVA